MELVGKVRPEACSFTRDDAVPDEVTMPGPTGCRCLTRSENRWPDTFYAGTVVVEELRMSGNWLEVRGLRK